MSSLPPLLVLAGGFGTRLLSAVGEVPKPLAPVANRPFLHYLVESWLSQGVTSLVFLLHHKAKSIEDFLQSLKARGLLKNCVVQTLTEPDPLGTGGAVNYAVNQLGISGSFLVANADTWIGSGSRQVGMEGSPAMAILQSPTTERYGGVRVKDGMVAAFQEKSGIHGPGLINAGLYHLPAELFRQRSAGAFSLERDVFPELVSEGRLKAVELQTEFIDIGIPEDYFRFCRWIESEKKGSL
jgi:D-glycero-alpha-D-manno-heptose 1-phosphate guanylyltransferase